MIVGCCYPAGSLAVQSLNQELKGRWFEYPSRQGDESVHVPLSKELNPNFLQGRHTTMAGPVKQHNLLHQSGVCDDKT
jgi:hypothetical protein